MKPAPFAYARPDGLERAVALLAEHGEEAKVLAGGQSLVPMLNFRLTRPAVIVDLDRVGGLDGIDVEVGALRIGAMVRQAAALRAVPVTRHLPLLAEALRHVGHHQIRTRGTIGGSLAHADPAAELPAVARLLDATVEVSGPHGERTIAAADLVAGPFTTTLAPDEVLTAVRFPTAGIDAWAFEELARRGGDFAVAGVASARVDGRVRLVAFGLGWAPQRLEAAERALADGTGASGTRDAEAVAAARAEVDPVDDHHADAAYRREAIGTLVARCLARMAPS